MNTKISVEKISTEKMYYCSICNTNHKSSDEATKCFDKHVEDRLKYKCDGCKEALKKSLPKKKFSVRTAYYCVLCGFEWDEKSSAKTCFDSHLVEEKCLKCGKDVLAIESHSSSNHHSIDTNIVPERNGIISGLDYFCNVVFCDQCFKEVQEYFSKNSKLQGMEE